MSAFELDLIDAAGGLAAGQHAWLCERVHAAAGVLGATGCVRVRLVADTEMIGAHGRWMNDPTTTDVLTFDMGTEGTHLDVDVWACVDEARRAAAARGIAAERELLLYILHAMLHCLGHDDTDEASSREMHRREDEVLRAIGVGDTYALPAAAGAPERSA